MLPALRRAALATPALGVLLLAGLTAPPAQAATYTSTGVRCTIVGTPGPDVLVGTARRDVICGRGGDDVIRAAGGDDLVDAGPGRDRVLAGAGADRVLAGTGADRVSGGDGADRISGGDGADTLGGGGGADTVNGGAGADDVEGDAGADSVNGGDGADTLDGDTGADTVDGGGQDDVIDGGDQGDDLNGGGGDDDITGGAGVDDVDGGTGRNLCVVDAEDESIRCRYDEQPPVLVTTVVDPGTVDVTKADAEVTVRVHATDDTGVDNVQGWLEDHANGVALSVGWMELVSGTDRDGWWQGTVTVPRWTPAVALYADMTVTDRQGRTVMSGWDGPAALQVADATPDVEGPQLTLQQLSPTAVDVRTGARDVTVSVHGTDAPAGVARLDLCLSRPGTPTKWNPKPLYGGVVCQEDVPRTSGTARDGVWTVTLTVPKGAVGGTYNVEATAEDRVSNDVRWMGPDAYQAYGNACCTDAYAFAPGPAGDGRLDVTGTVADGTAARTDTVTASKTELDTLPDDDSTHLTVHALDVAGEGVTSVRAMLVSDGSLASDPQFPIAGLQITSGTVTDGTWEGDVVAPQGTPPGTYHLLVEVDDPGHSTWFTDPDGPMADGVTYQPLAGIPTVTVVAHQG